MASAMRFAVEQEQRALDVPLFLGRRSEAVGIPRKFICCDECSQDERAACTVELRFLCVEHFVAYCYRRLQECGDSSQNTRDNSTRNFLRESATQATKLLLLNQRLPNLHRARLFDILLWANELLYRSIAKP